MTAADVPAGDWKSAPSPKPEAPKPALPEQPTTEGDRPREVAPPKRPAPAPPVAPPGPKRKSRLGVGLVFGAALVGLGLLAALVVVRASPADGGLLDLVRAAPSEDPSEFPAIGPEFEAPRSPGEAPRRKPVRRDPPKVPDVGVAAEPPAPKPADPAPPIDPPKPAPPPETLLAAPARPDGSLLVSCAKRCRVYLDGGLVGESPKAPIPLSAGPHVLRAVNPDTGEEQEQTIVIRSEERTRVVLPL